MTMRMPSPVARPVRRLLCVALAAAGLLSLIAAPVAAAMEMPAGGQGATLSHIAQAYPVASAPIDSAPDASEVQSSASPDPDRSRAAASAFGSAPSPGADDVSAHAAAPILTPSLRDAVLAERAAGRLDAALALAVPLAESLDADSLYFLGSVAQEAGDLGTAAAAYERAVMVSPEFAGAWLDWAVVTQAQGDTARAQQLFDYVIESFQPPPEILARIEVLRQQPALASAASPRAFSGEFRVQAGYDSNANSGVRIGSIPLLLGGDIPIDVPVAPEERARGSSGLQAAALLRYDQPLSETTRLQGIASLSERHNFDVRDFDTRDLTLAGALTHQRGADRYGGRLTLQNVELGSRQFLRGVRLGGDWSRGIGDCRIGTGVEWEARRYADFRYLDSHIVWLEGMAACEMQAWDVPIGAALLLRTGRDSPLHDRPGGATRRNEALALVSAQLAPRVVLEGLLNVSWARDDELYSELMGDIARDTRRTQARLTLYFPVAERINGFVSIDRLRQTANLGLFTQHGYSLWTGVRYAF